MPSRKMFNVIIELPFHNFFGSRKCCLHSKVLYSKEEIPDDGLSTGILRPLKKKKQLPPSIYQMGHFLI